MDGIEYFFPVLRMHSLSSGLNFSITTFKKRKRYSEGEYQQSTTFGLQHDVPSTLPSHLPTNDTFTSTSDIEFLEDDHSGRNSEHSDWPINKIRTSSIPSELESLKPPLRVAKSQNLGLGTIGRRQQHLRVLMAVLHRSMLEADYSRAGRAWGMLLRAEISGHSFDLRTGDRWGVGAEISMQSNRSMNVACATDQNDSPSMDRNVQILENVFSLDGFTIVKDYYERLLLQYRYQKTMPNLTNPLKFYPAMFSLWIKSILDQRQLAERVQDVGRSKQVRDQESFANGSESVRDNTTPLDSTTKEHDRQQIRKKSLSRAYELAELLAALTSSPPYSDMAYFWKLSGMIAHWVSDLHLEGLSAKPTGLPFKRYHQMKGEDWEGLESGIVSSDKHENTDVAGFGKAVLKARDFFEKASLSR